MTCPYNRIGGKMLKWLGVVLIILAVVILIKKFSSGYGCGCTPKK